MRQAQRDSCLKYGFQVLASCKQLYCEGYAMFYSLNTFHLASGPLYTDYFDNLLPHHSAYIAHFGIGLSMVDLTPNIVSELRAKLPSKRNSSPLSTRDLLTVNHHLLSGYLNPFFDKLRWLRSRKTLADVKINRCMPCHIKCQPGWASRQFIVEEFMLEHGQIPEIFSNFFTTNERLTHFMFSALDGVSRAILSGVAYYGWKGFSGWLEGLELEPVNLAESDDESQVCLRDVNCVERR